MYKPYLAESYHKEFISTLQAKGKLERPMTAADERRVLENNSTATRIFPATWGKEAVLENMVTKAAARIDAAGGKQSAGGHQPSAEAAGRCLPPKRDPATRHKIEARVAELELEVKAERARRERLEGEMTSFNQRADS